MNKKDEALKLALEALEAYKGFIDDAHILEGQWHWIDGLDSAQTLIREALAEQPAQQQESYGWKVYGDNSLFMDEFAEADEKAEAKRIGGTCIAFPLYTSPQPAQQQEPEKVGRITANVKDMVLRQEVMLYTDDYLPIGTAIYTSPPASKPWVGLTDEEIGAMYNTHIRNGGPIQRFARAIEAAHGITGEQK